MQRFQITTLVDITRSQASRSETDRIKIGQQANFNSLIQTIGLRTNITWEQDPVFENGRLPTDEGKACHWSWTFETERDDIFLKDQDPVGHLIEDLNNVPIVNNLKNSAELEPSCFFTQGEKINTWLRII
jgi:hypothetical protein